jgi:HB1, ASXL, restriction endonuclease HTH domain/PD-(D/E)XK endonuclease
MTSFKRAAVKVLRDSNEPLHYKEITKHALEEALVETSGATPERTMNTQITGDMKRRGKKSAFIRVQAGVYSLNPDYAEEEQNQEEIEEEVAQESREQISTQYIGKAGEHLVVSELLFRGYNASIMNVDEGLDIVATKGEHLYNIQVKTANENKFNSYVFDLRISSFEKHNRNNTFYIFVLKSKDTHFVILPYFEVQKNIDERNILIVNKGQRYRVNIKTRDDQFYLGKKENQISYFLNNWGLIR